MGTRRKYEKISNSSNFSIWMKKRLYENNMSVEKLANTLSIDKRTIYYHLNGQVKPTFVRIIAYCWAFRNIDNPYEILHLVEEDYKNFS